MITRQESPSIKSFVEVYESHDSIIFHSWQSTLSKYYEKDEDLKRLVQEVDGKKNIYQLWKILSKDKKISYKEVLGCIKELVDEDILTVHSEKSDFIDNGDDRMSRQLQFFNEYSTMEKNPLTFQSALSNSKVFIIGIGGTGSWVAQSLVMANVGELCLFDDDYVELSNLNRQPLFREKDIGKSKLTVTKHFLNNLNPNTTINTFNMKISDISYFNEIVLREKPDLVISCADNPSTKEIGNIITSVCVPLNIPHIIGGGYNSHIGMLGTTIIPKETACFKCYSSLAEEILAERENWVTLKRSDVRPKIGSIAPVAGLIGNFISLDAIKVLTGFAKPFMINKTIDYNFTSNEFDEFMYTRNPDCILCKGSA